MPTLLNEVEDIDFHGRVDFLGFVLLLLDISRLDCYSTQHKFLVAVSLPLIALYITWKTFKYATPLTARVVGGATKGAALIGGVAAGAYVGGAGVATTAARWGPKAAAGQAIAQKAAAQGGHGTEDGPPAYRRTENDPSGATADASSDKRGMEYDRGIH